MEILKDGSFCRIFVLSVWIPDLQPDSLARLICFVMIRTYEHDFGASKSPETYGLNKFGASVGQSLPKCVSNTVSVCDFFYTRVLHDSVVFKPPEIVV